MSIGDRLNKLEEKSRLARKLHLLNDPNYDRELMRELIEGRLIPLPPIEYIDVEATIKYWLTKPDPYSSACIGHDGKPIDIDGIGLADVDWQ